MPDPSPLESARTKQKEVLQEAGAHAESESARLLALLRRTEDYTRQIALAEAQILRQEELQAHLKGELATLSKRKAEVEKDARMLSMEREASQKDLAAAEEARAKLDAEVQQQLRDIKRIAKEKDDLEREVDKLQIRSTRLEESVGSLQKAREEYLAKIESLKSRQDALSTQ